MASIEEKAKNNAPRSILLIIYTSLITLVVFAFALVTGLLLASDLLGFVQYLVSPETSPISALSRGTQEGLDGLVVVIQAVELFAYSALFGLAIWIAGAVVAFWRGSLKTYQTLLTVAVAIPTLSFIFLGNLTYTFYGIVNLLIFFFLAHFDFYPEYRRMGFGEILRDLRVIRVGSQFIFAFIFLSFIQILVSNIYANLAAIDALPDFDFLYNRSGFQINQSPDWYSSNSRYGDAFIVGVINTINVVWIGLLLSTILGIFLGIFLLSRNWIIRNLSNVYVEILRNTPLLVQLIFWFFVVWFNLPEDDITIPNESMLIVYLRFFVYLVTILGIWFYDWRTETAPPRLINGVLTGVLILEGFFYVLGDSYGVIIMLALLGAGLIFAAKRPGLLPESQEGFTLGIGILAVSQFLGHLILDGMAGAGIIENARLVYGEVFPAFIISRASFIMPQLTFTLRSGIYALILIAGGLIILGLYYFWGWLIEKTGRDIPRLFYAFLLFVLFAVGGWYLLAQPLPSNLYVGINGEGLYMIYEAEAELAQQVAAEEIAPEQVSLITSPQAFVLQIPQLNRFGRVEVGSEISPSYMALLVGLVIYTSAFIGEIVRAGIQAVPYGQLEASRALGLSNSQALRMIVLPQALRVIIPPLGNQYLNLAKNSTLAVALAYSDTYQVGTTVMNQSGQSVTGFLIILVVYLVMSLIISFFMNIVNARFQLVTR